MAPYQYDLGADLRAVAMIRATKAMLPHGSRAHSKLGPSAAHRWLECPGSINATENIENKSTWFALEGTAAHEFVEFCLSTGRDPRDWIGGVVDLDGDTAPTKFRAKGVIAKELIDKERYFEIDEDMASAVEDVQELVAKYHKPDEGDIIMLETRLDMTFVHPKLFGTGDIIIYKSSTKTLIVIDFKYGRGYAVDVLDNPQALTYAVGAVKLVNGVDKLILVIVQPRAFHADGPVRDAEYDLMDLDMFEGHLRMKALETDDPNAPRVAGEQCKFCPAAYKCKTLFDFVVDKLPGIEDIDLTTDRLQDGHFPADRDLTADQMGTLIHNVKIIEGLLKRVMGHAHAEGMAGRLPTGTKMVDKRAYRKWANAAEVIAALDMAGIPESEFMTAPEPELKSVTQLEKTLGKKVFDAITYDEVNEVRLWNKNSTGYVLATLEDRRPAVALDKSAAFGAVDDE
jgi:hypothetical protein